MSRQRKVNIVNNSRKLKEVEEVGQDEHDSHMDEQLVGLRRKFPWKTIVFIIFFLIAGVICLTCSLIISIGRTSDDRLWPLMILGVMMFIPGGYYGFILLNICCKRKGYTVEDLPIL